MKIILIYLITLTSLCLTAQENPFIGNWEHDNDTTIFRVILEENNEERIRGDYELVEKISGRIIYESREDLNYGLVIKDAIRGGSNSANTGLLGAFIKDRIINYPGYQVLIGDLKMELLNTSPYQTATWKVKRGPGIRLESDTRVFTIPTDIILTKIDNNPVIDD